MPELTGRPFRGRLAAWHRGLAVVAFVVLGCVATDAQPAVARFQIKGAVYERDYPLPGVEITVQQTGHTAITDERGTFTIDDVPSGRYDVTATLAGFRRQTRAVSVPQSPGEPLKFALRFGLIAETHWVPFDPGDASAAAAAIAHVRLNGLSASKLKCSDIDALVAIHDATVISVWRGRLPAKIQIFENDTGSCIEDDGSVTRFRQRSSYPANTEYIVFLFGDTSPYGRLGPAAAAFRVSGSRVNQAGFIEGLPDKVDLRAFRERVLQFRHLTGTVTDSGGHPLEGAEIRIENRDGVAATADARGEFTITGLAPGSYVVTATLQGFRTERQTVSLRDQETHNLKFVMRVGLFESPLYVMSSAPDAVRQATAIARLRLDGFAANQVKCDDLSVIAAVRNAAVVEVWKGELAGSIQVWEDGIGSCVESDGSIVQSSNQASSYSTGADYIVLLTGSGPRFGGLGLGSRAFRIQGSLVETNGFLELPETIELHLFKQRLEELWR